MPVGFKVWNESSTELQLLVGNVTHQHENGKILYYNISLAEGDRSSLENETEIEKPSSGNKTETGNSASENKTEINPSASENKTFVDKSYNLFYYKVDMIFPSSNICKEGQLLSNQTATNGTVPSNRTSANVTIPSNQTAISCTCVSLLQWITLEVNHSYNTHKCKLNITVSQTSAIMEYLIGNLTYYTFYTLTASACTSAGCGPRTGPFVVRTDEHTPTCSPINVTVRNTSSIALLIQWDRTPENCTHGIITMYTLYFGAERRLKNFNSTYWHPNMTVLLNMSNIRTVPFPSHESAFSDLKKFVSHCVLLQAHTSKGPGPLTPLHCAHTAEDGMYILVL